MNGYRENRWYEVCEMCEEAPFDEPLPPFSRRICPEHVEEIKSFQSRPEATSDEN